MSATIYTSETCPWCVRAKKLLDLHDISYQEVSGKSPNWKTVPYIEIDGEHVGGFVELASYCRKL